MSDKPSIHDLIEDLVPPAGDNRYADPVETRKRAMDYLARRDHARQELIEKLQNAGFDADVSESAVAKLAAEGLQSDSRFVEAFIRSRINQGKGPAKIRADLGQRGISDAQIRIALEETEQDWRELARTVRARKFGPGQPRDFRDKARQMRFLQYRGFESEHIRAAMSTDDE